METDTAIEVSPKDRILAWADKHGVTMACEFVPLSQSRNKGEKSPTLNWRVTIIHMRQQYRDHTFQCGETRRLPVKMAKATRNLSGEVTSYCPDCGARSISASEAKGGAILTTDYSAGCAHCPSYKARKGEGDTVQRKCIAWECEHGKPARWSDFDGGPTVRIHSEAILPDLDSVLWSLAMDYGVIDAGGFESWASEYGYDSDSRKAEATYRACLDIAFALRAALGDAAMQELQDAGQDY